MASWALMHPELVCVSGLECGFIQLGCQLGPPICLLPRGPPRPRCQSSSIYNCVKAVITVWLAGSYRNQIQLFVLGMFHNIHFAVAEGRSGFFLRLKQPPRVRMKVWLVAAIPPT